MSDLVSKCVLRVEVNNDNDNGDESPGARASESPSTYQGRRKVKDICVETFTSRLETPRSDWGLLPSESREPINYEKLPEVLDEKTEIGFFSGNPFVEVTKGILHLYKEDKLSSCEEALTLCILGVPTSMTCHDLLNFTAPCHADIAHIRVLRDSSPNQYMALLTFRNHITAKEFYETYNGVTFNSLEPDHLCRTVWVSHVEWAHDDVPPFGHTELPMCPVCLERMDESVDGVLTIQCNHAFHASCLEKWGDSTCPVCRCVQSPEQAETSECERCGRAGPSPDALWICLICGHVGCGRYQGGHAALHYRESGHCYALQLGSHRVWDYKGDNFVHRLLKNEADGKLVPVGVPSEAEGHQEKVDSVQLEFTYLLTSQLDEQRMYFENQLAQVDSKYCQESKALRERVSALGEENAQLKDKLSLITKEKQAQDKKIHQQNAKLNSVMIELNDERQLGKALRANQQQWQDKITKLEEELTKLRLSKDTEIKDLQEQCRDLMFSIQGAQAISNSANREEIEAGTVTVGAAPQPSRRRGGRKRAN